jgi:sulfatase modifying factor 1
MPINTYDRGMAGWRSRSFGVVAAAFLLIGSCGRVETAIVEPRSGARLVRIPAGAFDMGSAAGEVGHRPDETRHHVILTRPFYLSATEVTQEGWARVMGNQPSHFHGPRLPVENVTWFDVQEFLRRLNASRGPRYRLPTEAEWEYACRAGTATAYNVGDRLSTGEANYDGRSAGEASAGGAFRGTTTPVASFRPNAWGLYDMHGNVWEWCADEYCPYAAGTTSDPVQACGSPYRVIRGGSWYFGADSARSALRYTHEPGLRGFSIGFRIVREAN